MLYRIHEHSVCLPAQLILHAIKQNRVR